MAGGYNTILVLVVTVFLGISGGVLGTFVALRGRTLVSDAIAHATLAGIAIAFLTASLMGQEGQAVSNWQLLAGALISGLLAAKTAFIIPVKTDPKANLSGDAAVAFSLVLFFSIAVLVLSIIQNLPYSGQAGLSRFLIGNVAAVGLSDAVLSVVLCLAVLALVVFCFKEFTAICFDEEFFSVTLARQTQTENLLILATALFAVASVQIVGVVFTVALLIIPYGATHLWIHSLKKLCLAAGLVGAISGIVGTLVSLGGEHRPTGTMIILCATAMFMVSAVVKSLRKNVVSNH